MATLTALQGRGDCRIPTAHSSLVFSQRELSALMRQLAAELYPHKGYSAALTALQARPDAACLIREAAVTYRMNGD